MTDSTSLAVPQAGPQVIDSLSANEFALELDGQKIKSVLRVSGLVSFKLDVKSTNALKQIHEPFKIVKMVERDPQALFNIWIRESAAARADIVRPKRTIAILAVDDGVPVRRWTAKAAWISEVAYSEFNTGLAELVEETLTIQCDEIEEQWLVVG